MWRHKSSNLHNPTILNNSSNKDASRAVFKWLSKVITWLRLLAIATLSDWLKSLAPVFQPMRIKTTMYAWFFPRFERVRGNCYELLSAPVVIGRSNCFGFVFSTVIWKPLYNKINAILHHFERSSKWASKKFRVIYTLIFSRPRVPIGTFIDFTLPSARRFYSSMGNPLGRKGLTSLA